MKLTEWIARKVPVKFILGCMNLLTKVSRVSGRMRCDHRKENGIQLTQFIQKNQYIENQPGLDMISFGKGKHASLAFSGCEIIAVYNALQAIRVGGSLADLICDFEKRGACLGGRFGVAPKYLHSYLDSMKVPNRFRIYGTADRVQVPEDQRALIVTFYNNRKDLKDQIHTVCMTREEGGVFTHNRPCVTAEGEYVAMKAESFREAVDALEEKGRVLCTISL